MDGKPRVRWILLSVLTIVLITTATLIVFAEPATYHGVTFLHGDRSFADRVVSYSAASCAEAGYDDPRAALGPPDCGGEGCHVCHGCDPCAVALGFRLSELDNRGWLVLEFVDNTLIDVAGEDLFIYITNNKACRVEISVDGINFISVGEVTGCPGGIDIAPFVTSGEEFRFVRLWDVPGDEEKSLCPGPSIDAVGAMGDLRQLQERGEAYGSLELLPMGELSLLVGQAPQDLLIILDSSSSMAEPFETSTKIEVARGVLKDLVATDLPDGMRVGLRIFGGCEYSQLLHPIAPLDRAAMEEQIQSIETGGPTPIAYTLKQAKDDFADIPGTKLILLVSDGIETCHGDPVAAARDLIATGYKLRIDVIGFDLGEVQGAREQMIEIAKATGGTYYDAKSSEELRMALRVSVRITYHIYDQEGTEVFSGTIGEPGPQLASGIYRVVLDTIPPIVLENVAVQSGRRRRSRLPAQTEGIRQR